MAAAENVKRKKGLRSMRPTVGFFPEGYVQEKKDNEEERVQYGSSVGSSSEIKYVHDCASCRKNFAITNDTIASISLDVNIKSSIHESTGLTPGSIKTTTIQATDRSMNQSANTPSQSAESMKRSISALHKGVNGLKLSRLRFFSRIGWKYLCYNCLWQRNPRLRPLL